MSHTGITQHTSHFRLASKHIISFYSVLGTQLNEVIFRELIICQASVSVTVVHSILCRSHECSAHCFLNVGRKPGELCIHGDSTQKFSWRCKTTLGSLITVQQGVVEKPKCKAEHCLFSVKYFYLSFCPKQLRKYITTELKGSHFLHCF